MVLDGFALATIALLLVFPAKLVARISKSPDRRWHAALTVFAWIAGTGLLLVEHLDAHALLSGFFLQAVFLVFALALASSVVAWKLAGGNASERAAPARHLAFLGIATAAAALVAALVGWPTPSAAPDDERVNVMLVSLDTLRADHLGCYGYERDTSPNLDALARRGTLFRNAFAPSHWTLPSHASMLTGLDPIAVGVLDSQDVLDPTFITVADTLKANGYRTAAFVSNSPYSYIGGKRGFDQGFDEYHHAPYPARFGQGILARAASKATWVYIRHKTGTATTQLDQVRKWLWRHQGQPFFLFLHLFDIHSDTHRLPYEAPSPFRGQFDPGGSFTGCAPNGRCASDLLRDYVEGRIAEPMDPDHLRQMVGMYDEGIAFADHELGRLLATLEDLDLVGRTVFTITSDHGEAFFEHGLPLHRTLNQENLHVPLIVVAPQGLAGNSVASIVRMQDVVPTIYDLAGVPLGPGERRTSLASWVLTGEPPSSVEPAVAFSSSQMAVRTERWKYIRSWNHEVPPPLEASEEELYDSFMDPAERENLLPKSDDSEATPLKRALLEHWSRSLEARRVLLSTSERALLDVPQKEQEALRALGYAE